MCTQSLKHVVERVPIIPKHRKILRFSFEVVQIQYNSLPLRYSLVPRIFHKCDDIVLSHVSVSRFNFLLVIHLLDMMSASHVAVSLGLLCTRRIQGLIWVPPSQSNSAQEAHVNDSLVPTPGSVILENPMSFVSGVPLVRVMSHVSVYKDASV